MNDIAGNMLAFGKHSGIMDYANVGFFQRVVRMEVLFLFRMRIILTRVRVTFSVICNFDAEIARSAISVYKV